MMGWVRRLKKDMQMRRGWSKPNRFAYKIDVQLPWHIIFFLWAEFWFLKRKDVDTGFCALLRFFLSLKSNYFADFSLKLNVYAVKKHTWQITISNNITQIITLIKTHIHIQDIYTEEFKRTKRSAFNKRYRTIFNQTTAITKSRWRA